MRRNHAALLFGVALFIIAFLTLIIVDTADDAHVNHHRYQRELIHLHFDPDLNPTIATMS